MVVMTETSATTSATNSATAAPVGDVCRLRVYGPESRVELAVPVHVPLADLLPTLLQNLDEQLATSGLEHGGWVLQRLGEPPLEENLGTAALGLYDGDIVHLRPRDDQLPPIDFDDLVDGVATNVNAREDNWRPVHGKRVGIGCAAVAGLLGLLLLARLPLAAAGWWSIGLGAVVLLVAAAAASRSFGDLASARLLSLLGMGFAAYAGATLPMEVAPATPGHLLVAPSMLAFGVFVAVGALACRFGTGTWGVAFTATAVGALLVALTGLLGTFADLSPGEMAASLLPVVLVLGYFVPTLAAGAAGLRVPLLPRTAEEFQQNLEPESSKSLLKRAAVVHRCVIALYTALAILAGASLVALGAQGGAVAIGLVIDVCVLLLLHFRELTGVWHRVAMLAPAAAGVSTLILAWADGSLPRELGAAAGLVLVALGACAAAHFVSGRKLIPHWGLAGDILHWLVAIAVVPLALWVAGVYTAVSGLWS